MDRECQAAAEMDEGSGRQVVLKEVKSAGVR